jgi:hypothetical protein
MIKKIFFSLLLILIIPNNCFAFKVENIPLISDFHIGISTGVGTGINIGANALLSYRRLKFGFEVEQLMTDVNYSATINATRFGGVIGYVLSDVIRVNYHLGNFNFMPSRLFQYQDSTGQTYRVNEATNYKGQYWALSLDYYAWDFLFSPKFIVNGIYNQGMVREIDFNIGKSF